LPLPRSNERRDSEERVPHSGSARETLGASHAQMTKVPVFMDRNEL
jgi:hypothetical protein